MTTRSIPGPPNSELIHISFIAIMNRTAALIDQMTDITKKIQDKK